MAAKFTPRRILWLAGACLLLLPAFVYAAEPGPGRHADARMAFHAVCRADVGATALAQPVRRIIDDNDNDAESDDLIGDSWLAPCALLEGGSLDSPIGGLRGELHPHCSPAIRPLTTIDPFAPRPPPVRFQP